MKKYENYQNSNISWIKSFPLHWGILRGKYLYKKENRMPSDNDEIVTCFRDGTVTLRKNRRTTGFTESLKEVGYQGIKKGDLIIHVMDAFAGSIGVSDSDGKGTPVYSVCSAIRDINNYYYAYLLREMARTGYIQSLYRGIRERSSDFRFDVFAAQYYIVPPHSEQDQIVRYLDWQTSRINKLINGYKRQIELLEERKKAVVSNAIIYGLKKDVPLKNSGVYWIGDIPQNWSTIKLRRILSPVSIKNCPDIQLLSVVREQGVIIRDTENKESNHNYIPDDLSNYKVVKRNQFVINKMKAWQGSYGVSEYDGLVSPAYLVFNVNFNNLEYFHYAIRSKVYVNFFAQASDGIRVGQWDLDMQKMKEIPFIVPSEEEQVEIVRYIKKEQKKLDVSIEKWKLKIVLLKEYRTRLISDVVTGQIDVRDIDIPEYVSEEEYNDDLQDNNNDMEGDINE